MSVEKYIYFLNIAKPILIFFYIMTILYIKKRVLRLGYKKNKCCFGLGFGCYCCREPSLNGE